MTDYNPTDEGLRLMRLAGVDPSVAWSALASRGRLIWHLDELTAAIFGQAASGEYIVVGIREAGDGEWEVTGARFMEQGEIERFEERRH